LRSLFHFIFKTGRGLEILRYLFIGVTTTAVSFAVTFVLRDVLHVQEAAANAVGIVISIVYAYFTNKLFVFRKHVTSFGALLLEFVSFIGSRAFTMVVGMVAIPSLAKLMHFYIAWGIVNIFIIVANYIFSKLIVFRKPKPEDKP